MVGGLLQMQRFNAVKAIAFLSIFFITGCIGGDELKMLNKLIDTLDNWPGQWEQTLSNTIDDLETAGTTLSKQVAKDLRSVEQEAFTLVSCEIEFIGQFIRRRTMEIRHERWPKNHPEAPFYAPFVCTTEPQDYSGPQE